MPAKCHKKTYFVLALLMINLHSNLGNAIEFTSSELQVGKVCPVHYGQEQLGILVFSKEWYHVGRENAQYVASDNANGIGLEIHMFANTDGQLSGSNKAACDRYRLLQIRSTNAKLLPGELAHQIDVPDDLLYPFYDASPMEFGYGTHPTPADRRDKPWQGQPMRAATVSMYDTPYISSRFGIEGQDIEVNFETCVVCGRNNRFDTVLSCGQWGYKREFLGGMSGWAEPDFIGVSCLDTPSARFQNTLNDSPRIDYNYWLDWR